jgi:hypothetical protein
MLFLIIHAFMGPIVVVPLKVNLPKSNSIDCDLLGNIPGQKVSLDSKRFSLEETHD